MAGIIDSLRWIANDCKVGGWVSDSSKAASLTDFWVKQIGGASTSDSVKITSAGESFKRGFDAFAVLGAAINFGESGMALLEGVARNERGEIIHNRHHEGITRRVSEFVVSVFALGKHGLDYFGFINKVLDRDVFVPKETLQSFGWVSSVSTLAFAGNQIVFENVPELQANMTRPEGRSDKAISAFLKLVKHTALVGVGALALIATFCCPIPAVAIPVLLTIALVASVVSRFFDGLVLDRGPRGRPPGGGGGPDNPPGAPGAPRNPPVSSSGNSQWGSRVNAVAHRLEAVADSFVPSATNLNMGV